MGTWRDERGAYAIVFAVLIVALFIMIAMVVDLSNARAQVRNNRSRVDFATLAAGQHLPNDPSEACDEAWRYIRLNTPGLPSGSTSPCKSGVLQTFDANCDPGELATTYQATGEAPYDIRFTYPVPDGHPELQNVVREVDGADPCERFAITMRTSVNILFGGIVGAGRLSAPASSVVRGTKIGEQEGVVALLLLDPMGCIALEAGGNGGVMVFPAGTTPGFISVDTDASRSTGADNCAGTGKVAVQAGGNDNPRIWACGLGSQPDAVPPVCAPGGVIEIYAMDNGQDDCTGPDPDACRAADVPIRVQPQPLQLTDRLTRAPVDHRYNCKTGYPDYQPREYVPAGEVPVSDCEDPVPASLGTDRNGNGWTSDYIGELRSYVGTGAGSPSGFTQVADPDITDNCRVDGTVVLDPGNHYINCSTLTIAGSLTIEGGNTILQGGVDLQEGAIFNFNTQPDASTLPPECLERPDADGDGEPERPIEICPTAYSEDAAYLYLRSGDFQRATNSIYRLGQLIDEDDPSTPEDENDPLNDFGAFVYFHTGRLNFSGGGGQIDWIAPFEGPFEDLAMWSEGTILDQVLTGGVTQNIEGVFFTPLSRFDYTGSGGQDQANAQFLAWRMRAQGNGVLRMTPDPDRGVTVPIFGFRLIR